MPLFTRCAGVCNGQLILYCYDWFLFGCPTFGLVDPGPKGPEQAEDEFIRSLAAGTAGDLFAVR